MRNLEKLFHVLYFAGKTVRRFYILSGTSMPSNCIPLFNTLAVINESFIRNIFFDADSALATESSE